MKKLRLFLVVCGGTIIMTENSEGIHKPQEGKNASNLLSRIDPSLFSEYDVTIECVSNVDSSNISHEHWDIVSEKIFENYKNYDGFVVVHGTDTMAYTACALSFALQNIGKPVILTGSHLPFGTPESDAKKNLLDAFKWAVSDLSGIFLVFGGRIFRGTRCSKTSPSSFESFSSTSKNENTEKKIEKRNTTSLTLKTGFEKNIIAFSLMPGISPDIFFPLIQKKEVRGVVIRAFGPGNFPYSFMPVLETAKENKVPVVVLSQCSFDAITEMKKYDVGAKALEYGVIEGKDMNFEAASVKLMWALNHFPYEQIKTVMQSNLVGEISEGL
jgi:L-asparaginase